MTIHLVRHGKAGHRNDADPDDVRRHLSERGREQADRIATLLSADSITRVLSSSADRCVETVEPLAAKIGVKVEIHPHLFEGVDIERSWAVLESVASGLADDRTAVLCSHGDVIPELVRRAQLRGARVAGPTGWSKGSIWTLEHDGAVFTSASFTPPLDT